MKETKEIIIIENVAYQRLPGTLVVPHSEKSKTKNENETIVDELKRIKLPESIMKKMKIKTGYKLDVYSSGKNIILKKLNVGKTRSRLNKMIIDNKYEVKLEISTLEFSDYHKITTVDELGNVQIGYEILKKVGIVEKDILKICLKDDMIILIKKEKNNYRKGNFSNNRKGYK